jgi:thiamine biosynthesis lipoprotein ApbE
MSPAPKSLRPELLALVAAALAACAGDADFESAFSRLREIDAELNKWDPRSELARLNASAGAGPAAGKRYSHIMDPRTGRTVEGPLVSATVAVPLSENSDGPPLALLVLSPEAGLALANRLGLPAVLVAADKRVFVSRAARDLFTLTDQSYRLVE